MGSPMTSSITPVSLVVDLPWPVAVVCHDAGAANAIFALLAQDGAALPVRAFMEGPALTLWQQRFGTAGLTHSLEEAIGGASSALTGTGWASDLEHRARAMACKRGIPSAAMLDHWVNYPQRFTRHGQTVWPDQFWVTDPHARELASLLFSGAEIRLKPDLYLRDQVSAIERPSAMADLLYLLEPARDTWGRTVAGEFQALDYFASRLDSLDIPPATRLRLRPHPSDPPGKYDAWINAHPGLNAVLDTSPTLAQALSRARWAAGCESYALVVALAAGRKVFGTLPPWAPACRLPHRGIIHLRDVEGDGT